MSTHDDPHTGFERRARALLEESTSRLDGRIRSRITRARHAALERAVEPSLLSRGGRSLLPAGVAAAAVVAVLAVVVWRTHHARPAPGPEDVELLADMEAVEMLEDDSTFYEWAVAQDGDS